MRLRLEDSFSRLHDTISHFFLPLTNASRASDSVMGGRWAVSSLFTEYTGSADGSHAS